MKRKNIAVFFDGTDQNRALSPKERWSNVTLLYDAAHLTAAAGVSQVRKYIDGVGTRKGEAVTGSGFGIGLDERIEEAYEYLWQEVNNAKEDGEEPHLYLFGFSRGAYAARWLASLVQFSGIPKDNAPRRKMFENHRSGDRAAAEKLRAQGLAWDDVVTDFIGVWDTVEATVDPAFDLADVPKNVLRVCHAVAIDEWRFTFKPTLFNAVEKVKEAWFPGNHTDVGGGYVERAIADTALWWVTSGARDAGLLVDEDALVAALAERSEEVRYHDELFVGSLSAMWQGLNAAAGYPDKFFRTIGTRATLHPSVQRFAYAAPTGRATIPNTCVVMAAPPPPRGMVA